MPSEILQFPLHLTFLEEGGWGGGGGSGLGETLTEYFPYLLVGSAMLNLNNNQHNSTKYNLH